MLLTMTETMLKYELKGHEKIIFETLNPQIRFFVVSGRFGFSVLNEAYIKSRRSQKINRCLEIAQKGNFDELRDFYSKLFKGYLNKKGVSFPHLVPKLVNLNTLQIAEKVKAFQTITLKTLDVGDSFINKAVFKRLISDKSVTIETKAKLRALLKNVTFGEGNKVLYLRRSTKKDDMNKYANMLLNLFSFAGNKVLTVQYDEAKSGYYCNVAKLLKSFNYPLRLYIADLSRLVRNMRELSNILDYLYHSNCDLYIAGQNQLRGLGRLLSLIMGVFDELQLAKNQTVVPKSSIRVFYAISGLKKALELDSDEVKLFDLLKYANDSSNAYLFALEVVKYALNNTIQQLNQYPKSDAYISQLYLLEELLNTLQSFKDYEEWLNFIISLNS